MSGIPEPIAIEQDVYGTQSFAVDLPLPPSLNNLFPTVNGRRVASTEYRRWQRAAGLAAQWPRLTEDTRNRLGWAITIEARGLPHNRDLDNIAKPVLDLVAAMTGLRDAYCDSVALMRVPLLSTETDPYLHVRVGVAALTAA